MQALLPKPAAKKGKTLRKAHLTPIGSATYCTEAYWGVPIATCERAVALFAAPDRVQVRGLSDGLPVLFERPLPDGLGLPTTPRDPYDDGWDRPGVHGLAIHPTGARVAVAGLAPAGDWAGVVALAADGAERRWQAEDTFPHRLHFGPAAPGDDGGRTLWLLCERDGPTVVALDAETLAELGTCTLSEFPPPAYVDAYPHPTDDVGVFQAVCGQDGFWVKCVERGAKQKLKVRPQKLSAVHHDSLLYGYARAARSRSRCSSRSCCSGSGPT